MKIAFMGIKGLPSKGGAERAVEAIVQRLASQHELTVYCSQRYTPVEARAPGVRLVRLACLSGMYSHMTSVDLLAAWHAVLYGDYDLVHLHNIEASFVLPILRLKYKVISTAHGRITASNKWGRVPATLMRWMEIPYARLSNALTSVSQHDTLDLGSRYQRSVSYIPNGVELEPQVDLEAARSVLAGYDLTAGSYLMFAAGRIIPLKGAHVLLEALSELGRDYRLVVAGDLSHSADYARKLAKIADERVIFIPFLPSRAALLGMVRLSRLFVFPSTLEAMSTMLLEAASVGAPIVCSDIPGNLAVLADQALVFSNQDIGDLRIKLNWAMDHPEEMKELGLKGQAHVQQNFAWDRIVGLYNQLYQEVAGHG